LDPAEEMLSNHLSDRIARVPWSQLPSSEEPEGLSTVDDELMAAARNLVAVCAPVESLDYEVIENYAYREQQVWIFLFFFLVLFKSTESDLL
jgi:hypothetical protein